MAYSYEDYKHALIETGNAILMDLSHNWKRTLFDRKMDRQFDDDMSLTGDQIHSIMMLANSFLQRTLFMRLMRHPNFDKNNIQTLLEYLNPSPGIYDAFYLEMMRSDLWTNKDHITRSYMQQNTEIDVNILKNQRAMKEYPKIGLAILTRYDVEGISKVKFDRIYAVVKYMPELVDYYYETSNSLTYFTEELKELFVF